MLELINTLTELYMLNHIMTEKEKMIKGLLYNPNLDKALVRERVRVKDLCRAYNSLDPNEREKEHEVMKKILVKTKEHFRINPNFWFDYGYNIEIGENFFSNYNLVILDCAKVTFGDNVAIGPNCGFYAVGIH